MVNKAGLVSIGFIVIQFICFKAVGQTNRYMVFFTDKDTAAYEAADPLTYLSQRSLDRRQNQSIDLSARDFTVSPAYLDSVEAYGMEVYGTSRWLNACLASGTIDQVEDLQQSTVVDRVYYVAPQNVPVNGRRSPASRKKKYDRKMNADEVTDYQNNLLGIDVMQQDGYTGAGMLIAVVDGGFLGTDVVDPFAHIYTENRLIATYNFVNYTEDVYGDTDHGTKALSCMAGLIEGVYTGAVPDADYMLLVSEDVTSEYRVEEYNWILAAEMADSTGADIISTSLGYNFFNDPTMDYAITDMDGQTAVISIGSNLAAETGMLLVSSAGNEGDNANWITVVPPADAPSVLAVGSFSGETLTRASFSSTGPTVDDRIKPEVSAPGAPARCINKNGQPTTSYGTSFAAPIVSGLTAGFWQANRELSADEVKERIIRSGHIYLAPDSLVGHGAPNYERARDNIVLSDGNDLSGPDINPYPYPNPLTGGMLNVPVSGFSENRVEGSLISNDGRLVASFNITNISGETVRQIELENLPAGVYLLTLYGQSKTLKYRIVKY
ncbi:MAG: S8 family peptidase [Cyclobacteriaceae bacterium]